MTYSEQILNENPILSNRNAQKLVEEHNIDFWDFIQDKGNKSHYHSIDVLGWLGY